MKKQIFKPGSQFEFLNYKFVFFKYLFFKRAQGAILTTTNFFSIAVMLSSIILKNYKKNLSFFLKRSLIPKSIDHMILILNKKITNFLNYFYLTSFSKKQLKFFDFFIYKRLKILLRSKYQSKKKKITYLKIKNILKKQKRINGKFQRLKLHVI